MEKNDTISAIATPLGRGGIGVIRISGSKAKVIGEKISKRKLTSRIAYFSKFYDQKNHIIDQGLILYFNKPHSFTGEDVVELHGHGGSIVLDQLLKRVIQLGARIAEPGEFSKRAFLNNKIDLTQAEAIADLIDASSERAAQLAINTLQGDFSKNIQKILSSLIHVRTYIEASIDFSEDEVDVLHNKEIQKELKHLLKEIEKTLSSAQQGALFKEGITVVIAGKPNAGKSSLLNCLSQKESAIVTDIAGTTRDVLREYIQIDGIPLHIIDTAGIQKSDNVIEKEGIKRTWQEIEKADKVLLIIDSEKTKLKDPKKILPEFFEKLYDEKSVTIVKNKIDLINEKPKLEKFHDYLVISISAKKCEGIDLLKEHLKSFIGIRSGEEGLFLARRRHINALERAKGFLLSANNRFKDRSGLELIAEDLRQAQKALSEITGEYTSEDLLGEIFSTFCLGK